MRGRRDGTANVRPACRGAGKPCSPGRMFSVERLREVGTPPIRRRCTPTAVRNAGPFARDARTCGKASLDSPDQVRTAIQPDGYRLPRLLRPSAEAFRRACRCYRCTTDRHGEPVHAAARSHHSDLRPAAHAYPGRRPSPRVPVLDALDAPEAGGIVETADRHLARQAVPLSTTRSRWSTRSTTRGVILLWRMMERERDGVPVRPLPRTLVVLRSRGLPGAGAAEGRAIGPRCRRPVSGGLAGAAGAAGLSAAVGRRYSEPPSPLWRRTVPAPARI